MWIPDDDAFGDIPKAYCPNCLKAGIHQRLQEKVYFPGETPKKGDEDWLQCHKCGHLKHKASIEDEDEKEETDEKYK